MSGAWARAHARDHISAAPDRPAISASLIWRRTAGYAAAVRERYRLVAQRYPRKGATFTRMHSHREIAHGIALPRANGVSYTRPPALPVVHHGWRPAPLRKCHIGLRLPLAGRAKGPRLQVTDLNLPA